MDGVFFAGTEKHDLCPCLQGDVDAEGALNITRVDVPGKLLELSGS